MLAYLFWHCRRPDVAMAEYERVLLAFHAVLNRSRPEGLSGSAVVALNRVPWLGNRSGYADWYLVKDSAGLDVINRAAVTAGCESSHQRVAMMAADGIAGLYRISLGRLSLRGSSLKETWLSKPAGERYAQFFERIVPQVAGRDAALWQRQMALGPTPEFCLQCFDSAPALADPAGEVLDGRVLAGFGELEPAQA